MRSKRITSLLLAFIVLSAGFITQCHADEAGGSKTHFIAETCESHDCDHGTESESCTDEHHQHQICSDQSIASYFLLNDYHQLVLVAPLPMVVINLFASSEFRNVSLQSILDPPAVAQERTTILRI